MDYDVVAAYDRWCDLHPEWADKLPTSQTPRPGRHVLARSMSSCKTRFLDAGEFRGEGGIIVLPPSRHKTGEQYQWLIEPFGEIPIIDPSILVGAVEPLNQKRGSSAKSKRKSTPPTPHTPHMACVNSDKQLLIERAIEETLPTKFGQRNKRIFQFVRHLRKIFDGQTDPEKLVPLVEAWHKKALPNIRTKDFEETWTDFVHAWENVRCAAGASLETIKQLATEDSFTLGLGDLNQDKVARLLRAAAKLHAERGTFYMGSRTMSECVGLSHVACNRIAQALVAHGLLLEVEKGTVGTKGKATVWHWLGPAYGSAVRPIESAEPDFNVPLPLVHANSTRPDDSEWDWP
jgi:Bifunctional DNA primase/polymerase, N-terminal